MNSRRIVLLSLVIGLLAVGTAAAAPAIGTAKARGDYGSFGRETHRVTRSRPVYRSAPTMQTAPAPMVAQAPEDARRFSYAPPVPATTRVPCPQAPAAAPIVDGTRRYSYAPESAGIAPAARTYSPRPSYSGKSGRRSSVERWALPKTDPRKFNN